MKVGRLCLAGIALMRPDLACAQQVDTSAPVIGSMFDRNRSVSVGDRMFPGYERLGVRVGAFTVKPEATLGTLFVDNLYATETDKTSVVAATVQGVVRASLDAEQNRLNLLGVVQANRFISRSSENNTVFNLRADGRRDLGSGFVARLAGGYQRQTQARSDPGAITNSVEPIRLDVADASGELQWEGTRTRLTARGVYNDVSFDNGRAADGTVLPQDFRDRQLAQGTLQADYALTPDLAVRIEGSYGETDYRKTPLLAINRSSRRIELLAGATFEFTDLLRGEVGIGYFRLDYESPDLPRFDGIGGRVQLEYMPTLLTTLTLRGTRTIEESGFPLAPSYVRTTFSLTADHELYRNVILSATAGFQRNRFQQPSRTDDRPSFGGGARYRLSSQVSLIARYDYIHASVSPRDAGRRLDFHTASLGINIGK